MNKLEIIQIKGREILDSRGNPTVEAVVYLENGIFGAGVAPSGASTGAFEAHELRDQDQKRYAGKGVQKAVSHIQERIQPLLVGASILDGLALDEIMLKADGSHNKSELGANAMLAVSTALTRAYASSMHLPLYAGLGGLNACKLPMPMMNILNGGRHAGNSIDMQEFMIVPVAAGCFREALRMGTEIYHTLREVLRERGRSTAVGDEGGFAPDLSSVEEIFEVLLEAVTRAGYVGGRDICFAIDAAASEWKPQNEQDIMAAEHKITGQFDYVWPKSGRRFTTDELLAYYASLVDKYPIISIEDPLDEEDWKGWERMTKQLGSRVQIVGDDLFVTNQARLREGIAHGCANAILIKPNQIGTVSETLETIRIAKEHGYRTIISHRSGETEDTFISDLAVAVNAGQIKTGAPARSERVAKYNRLLRIEEELGAKAKFG